MSTSRADNDLDGIDPEAVRLTAYFLWEQDGRPPGQEFDYWLRARDQHRRQRQFDRMIAEGDPEAGQGD